MRHPRLRASTAALQRAACVAASVRRARRSPRCRASGANRRKRGVEEPGQPDAFAAPFVPDAIHAVVPVAGAHQRQAVRAGCQAAVQGAGAMFEQGGRSVRVRGLEVSVFLSAGQRRSFDERQPLVEDAASPVSGCSGPPRRAATAGRRKNACARPVRWADATSAAHRLPRTAARPRAAVVRAPCPGAPMPAPCRPAVDRGTRMRRPPGRTRRAPTCGRRASGTAASD